MNIKVISKLYGSQFINIETFNPLMASTDSTIFKIIEHIFNDWYDHNTQPGAPLARDIQGMYYGEGDQPAIYSKKGAIRQGIENFIEEVKEANQTIFTTNDILKMDIETAFE